MYNNTEEQLCLIDKNERGDKIKVTKIIDSKKQTHYDIRNMYTKPTGEISHTQKGVRVNSEQISDIIVALLKGIDEDSYQDLMMMLDEIDDYRDNPTSNKENSNVQKGKDNKDSDLAWNTSNDEYIEDEFGEMSEDEIDELMKDFI